MIGGEDLLARIYDALRSTKQVDTALARGQQAPAPRLAFSRSRPCPGMSLWM